MLLHLSTLLLWTNPQLSLENTPHTPQKKIIFLCGRALSLSVRCDHGAALFKASVSIHTENGVLKLPAIVVKLSLFASPMLLGACVRNWHASSWAVFVTAMLPDGLSFHPVECLCPRSCFSEDLSSSPFAGVCGLSFWSFQPIHAFEFRCLFPYSIKLVPTVSYFLPLSPPH